MKHPNVVLRGWRSIRQYANPVVVFAFLLARNRHVERPDQHLLVEGVETQTWVSTLVDDVDLAKSQEQFDKYFFAVWVVGAGSGCGNPGNY